ncbi:hypothetical protein AW878_12105 [Bordetella pseudohinzii]|uniref:Uncharacterized protein, possibly involved in aromatic compounds catabolism n=2 Tax=Bordetella pseudohinzii TaxID=1331258 RepID=A0A0J6C3E5_9BORD|nr:PaaI family thioesterase [Bordetella pseudohinzii]ANY16220.1 hypothetical protein BBN53_10110 [Bordetella pseudohinzii]KMM25286.1 hypothetical protein L540_20675 [Bordetella pseudohinzii]KXA78646.1 hypothetical protein AW878_12105 [Bordetella pseudohinzii]KXA81179.1 hypothetical protein AW877_04425 [Bordetella pseudohinzii]CUJ05455.1 Uncharacterized protein%2C possibly involved in aromatic compounds catabolism [Bordetella pseudohinzii]
MIMLGRQEAEETLRTAMPGCVRGLGIAVEDLGPGRAVLRMPPGEAACREGGIFSGQALSALADTAMCFAVWTDGRGRRPVATIDLHMTFISGCAGEEVVATAELLRSGRGHAFTRVDIVSAGGKAIASGMATFGLPA